ncbi:hypothetical protein ACP70R_019816 [Stipagrostis hirtigluma subsp. patula]
MGASFSRRGSTTPSLEYVPDDALAEMLLRVPPHPACLLHASLVSRHLRRVIAGPNFLRAFRERHRRAPPLLGFFHDDSSLPHSFLPVGDSPDRVSAAAFDPKEHGWRVVDSRHGRVLLQSPDRLRLLVWDPMAGGRRRYIDPPPLQTVLHYEFTGAAVVCAAGHGEDHGDCHDSPFRVVFVATLGRGKKALVYVYSSELGLWDEVASGDLAPLLITERPPVLLRNVLYWTMAMEFQHSILAFNLETHELYLINQPVYMFDAGHEHVQVREAPAEGGGMLGIVAACGLKLQLWTLQAYNGKGTEQWVNEGEIDLDDLALVEPMYQDYHIDLDEDYHMIWILGVEGSVAFVRTEAGIFEVDLKTSVSKRICDGNDIQTFYPYRSFFPARVRLTPEMEEMDRTGLKTCAD